MSEACAISPRVTMIPATRERFTSMPIHNARKRRVAAYARVSTRDEEQRNSYEAQVDHYTRYIQNNAEWEFAGVYADRGITGTSTKKREHFNDMIEDALAGKIDLIITKSVSRFARNTVDSLTTIRTLKERGIEVFFEEQNIYMENVCTEYAANKRIALFNCTGRNAEAVSDFTIGLIIAEARNIARGHYGVRNGQWIRDYPNGGYIPDLPGRTVGLIGCGMIGMKVAKKLSGFDVRVLGYDPYADTERCACEGIELVPLETLMSQSDFVTLHARLTEQNRHLVNAEMISKMKSTAYLINTSRAGLIDEQALVEALRARRIMGAALDVFEQEPLEPGNPILELENVTLTPHMAGGSNDAFFNTPHRLCEQMQAWMEKQG